MIYKSQIAECPKVEAFKQRCERVSAEVERRIEAAKHPKPTKARAFLWFAWMRRNGLMGGR